MRSRAVSRAGGAGAEALVKQRAVAVFGRPLTLTLTLTLILTLILTQPEP